MITKKEILISVLIILIVLIIFGCNSKLNPEKSDSNYTPLIIKEFENKTWVPVIVRLEDRSRIDLNDSSKKYYVLQRELGDWYQPVIDKFVTELPEKDFKVKSKVFNGFRANVTKSGFEWLCENQDVGKIEWDER